MSSEIYVKCHNIDDEPWFNILLNSIKKNSIDGIAFPAFPDEQTQIAFVGGANKQTMKEIWPYYRLIRSRAQENGITFDENTRLLDVGSGWGRVIRFFLKDVRTENLYGMDTMQTSVDLCNKLFAGTLDFKNVKTMPPTDYEGAYFDIVEGYSVVSHLSRHSGLMWLDEYYRILKPGGLLTLTVFKYTRFDQITELQSIDGLEGYGLMISQIYTNKCETEREIFNSLGFDYKSYGMGIEGNEDITYGEAIILREYMEEYWCRYFDFVSYDDSQELAQAVVMLKKPAAQKILPGKDPVRAEQYEMMKQLDRMNGLTREIALTQS